MTAQLNIKDAETIELARGLAKKLGKSVTATIREALEEKARKRETEQQAKLDSVMELVADIRSRMSPEVRAMTSKEIMDSIYDEDGLPS
ncbi:MAG: type II toxin-antitoxin system VapB family antitoxin [Sphingomonas sp.]